MIGSEHWMTPLKNRCGNYVKQRARAGASPAPTIHDHIVSFARKSNGQSYRGMVGATLAVALKNAGALTRRAVALVCLSMVFAFLLPIPLAHAAATGRIYGQLLDGTKKNAPVVGQNVTLQMAQGNNARDMSSVKTDAHGSFAFNALDTVKTINYAVRSEERSVGKEC